MKRRIAGALAALFALVVPLFAAAQPAQAATGFHVSNGRILEGNGNDFVMRGVSHAHTWYPTHLSSLADIKALGANTVRVVLSTGAQWTRNDATDVTGVINQCKANRLICVLEAHDTTGYGEQSAAISLSQAADYWVGLKSVLAGQENYVIVNIGNEPYGNTNTSGWTADTIGAIQKIRNAGINNMLMVDAPNWGQDWSFTMRDNAKTVFAADTQANTVFSIHMYGVFDTAAEVSDYLNHFVSAKLPIVVGEFGNQHTDGNPDEDAIMSNAASLNIGYLGWSWSGNSSDVAYLDMVTNFDPTQLTTWGQRIFNGANGIKSSAKEATVYGGSATGGTTAGTTSGTTAGTTSGTTAGTTSGTTAGTTAGTTSGTTSGTTAGTTSGTTSGTTGGTGGACTATYTPNSWGNGFTADVTVKATKAVSSWKVTWTFGGDQKVTGAWNANVTQSGSSVTATNVSYNGSIAAGGSTSFGFQGTYSGTNGTPVLSCTGS